MDNIQRLGFLSSLGLVLVGVAYAVVVGFGIAQAGLNKPITCIFLALVFLRVGHLVLAIKLGRAVG